MRERHTMTTLSPLVHRLSRYIFSPPASPGTWCPNMFFKCVTFKRTAFERLGWSVSTSMVHIVTKNKCLDFKRTVWTTWMAAGQPGSLQCHIRRELLTLGSNSENKIWQSSWTLTACTVEVCGLNTDQTLDNQKLLPFHRSETNPVCEVCVQLRDFTKRRKDDEHVLKWYNMELYIKTNRKGIACCTWRVFTPLFLSS